MVYLNVSICAEHDRIHLPLEMKCYFRPHQYLKNNFKTLSEELHVRFPARWSRSGSRRGAAESRHTCERQRSASRSAPAAPGTAPPAAWDSAPVRQPWAQSRHFPRPSARHRDTGQGLPRGPAPHAHTTGQPRASPAELPPDRPAERAEPGPRGTARSRRELPGEPVSWAALRSGAAPAPLPGALHVGGPARPGQRGRGGDARGRRRQLRSAPPHDTCARTAGGPGSAARAGPRPPDGRRAAGAARGQRRAGGERSSGDGTGTALPLARGHRTSPPAPCRENAEPGRRQASPSLAG